MNESMVDVLIYLFENYMDGEGQPPLDQDLLEEELAEAGFSNAQIDKALHWLDELAAGLDAPGIMRTEAGRSMRIYTRRSASAWTSRPAVCCCSWSRSASSTRSAASW